MREMVRPVIPLNDLRFHDDAGQSTVLLAWHDRAHRSMLYCSHPQFDGPGDSPLHHQTAMEYLGSSTRPDAEPKFGEHAHLIVFDNTASFYEWSNRARAATGNRTEFLRSALNTAARAPWDPTIVVLTVVARYSYGLNVKLNAHIDDLYESMFGAKPDDDASHEDVMAQIFDELVPRYSSILSGGDNRISLAQLALIDRFLQHNYVSHAYNWINKSTRTNNSNASKADLHLITETVQGIWAVVESLHCSPQAIQVVQDSGVATLGTVQSCVEATHQIVVEVTNQPKSLNAGDFMIAQVADSSPQKLGVATFFAILAESVVSDDAGVMTIAGDFIPLDMLPRADVKNRYVDYKSAKIYTPRLRKSTFDPVKFLAMRAFELHNAAVEQSVASRASLERVNLESQLVGKQIVATKLPYLPGRDYGTASRVHQKLRNVSQAPSLRAPASIGSLLIAKGINE